MHHYHKLQEILGTHPVGAPKSDEFLEILTILFRPDEVELAVHLDFTLRRLGEISQRAGVEPDRVLARLEDMANRGSILAKTSGGEPSYALLPNYPGLFEYPVMKGLDEPTRDRLARLWHAYYMKDMAAELASADPPWNRILPAESALPGDAEILPFEVASGLMAKNDVIAVAACPCRTLARNCGKPLDVCLSFDGAARFLAERGMARVVTLDEARAVLRRAEEAGLVHTGSNNAEKLLFLCNCCPCCCHLLRMITEHGKNDAIARSSYQAALDAEACVGCGACEERCPTGAFEVHEGTTVYDATRCIGCGLCASTCPGGALSLAKRDGYAPPPPTMGELVKTIAGNKRRGPDRR